MEPTGAHCASAGAVLALSRHGAVKAGLKSRRSECWLTPIAFKNKQLYSQFKVFL